jgi:lauroyl/myristoyl acyltransferase
MQYHRSISSIDLLYPSLIENTKFNDNSNILEQSKTKSHIFVGYHAGSYNMILRCLAEKNIPFCVVANNDYIKDYEKIVQELYKDLPHDNSSERLQIFSAEDPKLLLKLTKNLSIGISVFIFIDGNSGTKKNDFSNDKNLLKIDFLNHHIYARQGVAFLSYLSKAPIVTVVAKRDENLNNNVTLNLLKTDELLANSTNRSDFINSITKKIYKELEVYLINNYEQWAGWLYLHNFFDTDDISEELTTDTKTLNFSDTKFTVSQYIHLVKHDENNIFLVKKKKYEIMRIERFLFDVLTYFQTPRRISTKDMNKQ